MKVKEAIVKAIPVPNESHPKPPFEALPKHEFSMGLIAPKGCGKTTTICNLLLFYKKYFHTIIIFSPTIDSDEKWDYIKKQELLIQNKPLIDWIKKKKELVSKDDIVSNRGSLKSAEFDGIVDEYDNDFDGKIPNVCFMTDFCEKTLADILTEQKKVITLLKKYGGSKYLANRILFIFDDLVGSSLFSSARESVFKGFNTRHRHYSASIIMVAQGYKEIQKTVRTNWSCMILFEITNDKELEVIYEEFSMRLKRDEWQRVYEYCVKDEFSFLFYNVQRERNSRIMKNFTETLNIKRSPEMESIIEPQEKDDLKPQEKAS